MSHSIRIVRRGRFHIVEYGKTGGCRPATTAEIQLWRRLKQQERLTKAWRNLAERGRR
jgi:hypothetical protein